MMFTYRCDIYTCKKDLHVLQGWCRQHSAILATENTQRESESQTEQPCEVFWRYSPSTKPIQSVYWTALLLAAQNRRKQLLLLALTSEEENMQREQRPGPAQLAIAAHDHENSRERQACDLSCSYFIPFLTHDGAKMCSWKPQKACPSPATVLSVRSRKGVPRMYL